MSDHRQHGALLARPPKRDGADRRQASPANPQVAAGQQAKKPNSSFERFIDRFFRLH